MIESISNFLPLGCAPHLVTALETDYEYPMIYVYIQIRTVISYGYNPPYSIHIKSKEQICRKGSISRITTDLQYLFPSCPTYVSLWIQPYLFRRCLDPQGIYIYNPMKNWYNSGCSVLFVLQSQLNIIHYKLIGYTPHTYIYIYYLGIIVEILLLSFPPHLKTLVILLNEFVHLGAQIGDIPVCTYILYIIVVIMAIIINYIIHIYIYTHNIYIYSPWFYKYNYIYIYPLIYLYIINPLI